ncbi:MAG: YibE/F family protein [Eubacteriales bacterium]|nr:YibE/F family protein [Eubacteriales bacterium]
MMLIVLTVIFVLLALFTGGDRTAKSIVTLFLSAGVMMLTIVAIYLGVPPLAGGLFCVAVVAVITTLFQNECNQKSMTALLAVFLTTAVLLLLIFVFVDRGHLAGMADTGQVYVRESNGFEGNIGIDMRMVEVAVLLITLVGAVIDAAIAVVAGTYEVAAARPALGRQALFRSGMRIGGNILSSTVNTLFFIFAGEYLLLFVNFMTYYSFAAMINSKEFAQGAISIAVSAFGCVLVIPVAAALAAVRLTGGSNRQYGNEKTDDGGERSE